MKTTEKSAVAEVFKAIKEQAESHCRELRRDKPVIMVGTATCGRAAGAEEVIEAFRVETKKRKIDAAVIEVGCMGHCYAEPLVIINKLGYPPVCYGYVNPVIAERLVKEFIIGDNTCSIKGKKDRKVHQTNIMVKLVISPLKEGGVDCHDGLEAAYG